MEKTEQQIRSENLLNASGKYLYWVIIIYGLVSFVRVIGLGFTYIAIYYLSIVFYSILVTKKIIIEQPDHV